MMGRLTAMLALLWAFDARATVCDTRSEGELLCDGRKHADRVRENDNNTLGGYVCATTGGGSVNGGNKPEDLLRFVCPEDGDVTFRLRAKSGALGLSCFFDLFLFESCDAADCAVGVTTNSVNLSLPYTCVAGQELWIAVEGDSVSSGGLGCDIVLPGFTLEGAYDLWVECPEECGDGEDDDWDNLIDGDDPDCCDDDGDGYESALGTCGGDDCDDNRADIGPARPERVANGVDENCDGNDDCWLDADADGYGIDVVVPGVGLGCADGRSTNALDCLDAGPGASSVHPGAPEVVADGIDQDCDEVDACWQDLDGDRFGGSVAVPGDDLSCGDAPGGTDAPGDCRDAGPGAEAVFPGAEEGCNGADDDCDGLVDDADPGRIGGTTWYGDADGDGFLGPQLTATSCVAPPGYGEVPTDCRDAGLGAELEYPGAPERAADGVDQDCDGVDHCPLDLDGDGFGGVSARPGDNLVCGDALGESTRSDDCVDVGPGAAGIFPGAAEICNHADDDCDGLVDDADPGRVGGTTWYDDVDGDSFPGDARASVSCVAPAGFGPEPTDCDDGQPAINPLALERCNQVDDDCDGLIDGDDALSTSLPAWVDDDGDGYGDPTQPLSLLVCALPPGVSSNAQDCDDARDDAWPGAPEVPYDGVDQDCDGGDLDDVDEDGAAFGPDCADRDPRVFPGAVELANGIDEDCDGRIDNGTPRADDDGDGVAELGGDCDDARFDRRPGLPERCDGVDEDCDGTVDEGTSCYDDDGDGRSEEQGDCHDGDATIRVGFGDLGADGVDNDCDGQMAEVDQDDDGYAEAGGDCDDRDAARRPGAPERENGEDDDCDGAVDEGTALSDDDGDGADERGGDCDDGDASVGPGAVERVDNYRDDDCDSLVDEGGRFADDDGDGWTDDAGDCDDADAGVSPWAEEVADGEDDDCDGVVDEGADDHDGDGWRTADGDCNDKLGWVNPGLIESCDALDNNCDGVIDEGACPQAPAPPPAEDKGCATVGGPGWTLALAALVARRRRSARG